MNDLKKSELAQRLYGLLSGGLFEPDQPLNVYYDPVADKLILCKIDMAVGAPWVLLWQCRQTLEFDAERDLVFEARKFAQMFIDDKPGFAFFEPENGSNDNYAV